MRQNRTMANTYLAVPFKDKDAAKALGARWDAAKRQWYAPIGLALTPFASWLSDAGAATVQTTALALVGDAADDAHAALVLQPRGISLSQLLAGVVQAVGQAFRSPVWTMVEVVELRASGGHVFIGVSERDAQGSMLAKASAVIWQSTADTILPEFERATGAQLAPGIKLLVRARPVFKAQHGFSLEIDAIDPQYTLGDLEARKREIRALLRAEGIFDANRQLAAPWDFSAVLVLAPAGGAGLGDFQAEANRLAEAGLCRFDYVFSRFQGEGAAAEMVAALQGAVAAWPHARQHPPDALVIIRGGGAVNDLAWLNDYALARAVCSFPVPVLSGIGHERDSTLIDEVAHIRFDTPSKVVAAIEQRIVTRAQETQANFSQVAVLAARRLKAAQAQAAALDAELRSLALRHIAQGRLDTRALHADIGLAALHGLRLGSQRARDTLQSVKDQALAQLAQAQSEIPACWTRIAVRTQGALRAASSANDAALALLASAGAQRIKDAATGARALMREIAGQGPEKTLRRGFAVVRGDDGRPLSRAAQLRDGVRVEIQFQDGRIGATAGKPMGDSR